MRLLDVSRLALGLATGLVLAAPASAKLPGTQEAPPLSEIAERARSAQGEEARRAELDAYAAGLRGARVRGWPAWVIRSIKEPDGVTWALSLAGDDPYAPGPAAHKPAPAAQAAQKPPARRAAPQDRPARLRLVGLPAPPALRPGQKIYVDGVLRDAGLSGGVELTIEQARWKAAPEPALPEGARGEVRDLQISLERTACLGRCPVYKISAAGGFGPADQGGGAVTWTGRSFVGVTGTQRGQVDAARLRQLYAAFLRADFWKLRDYESRVVTDHPGVVITLRRGKEQKTVRHYLGDPSAPVKLEILEGQIDELLGSANWITAAQ